MAGAISGISEWERITPDEHHDWIRQRSQEFVQFYPLGSEDVKAARADDVVFKLFSNGYKTGRDAYIYNFSRAVCTENARRMTQGYLAAIADLEHNPEFTEDEVARRHTASVKWDGNLKNKLKRKIKSEFSHSYLRTVLYRPFVATNCYADQTFAQRRGQMNRIFPADSSDNRVICVSGIGSAKQFSTLVCDTMPDVQLISNGQCFPRYRYPKRTDSTDTSDALPGIGDVPERIDNISDTALHVFCEHYRDGTITKDTIFDYVYGVLHAPSYREEFANDLSKMLPRIPFAPDFRVFAEAGKALGELHLGYERCERYSLEVVFAHEGEPYPRHFRLTEKAMRFADDDKTTLRINEHVVLSGIPAEAHRYVVNGRTPLEWYIDRYRIKRDKESGIVNDPNGWFEDPRDLVARLSGLCM